MSRKMLWGVLAGFIAVSGCATTKQVLGKTDTRSGVVSEVEENRFAIKSVDDEKVSEIWIQRTAQTDLSQDGEPVNWDDIEEGTPVRVSYELSAGPEKATKIEVLSGPKADEVTSEVEQAEEAEK